MLTAFMMLFFIVLSISIQNQTIIVQGERNEELAADVASMVNNEAVLASKVNDGYSRTFTLPVTIDGGDYDMELLDGVDLVIDFRGESHVFFLDAELHNTTPLHPGINALAN